MQTSVRKALLNKQRILSYCHSHKVCMHTINRISEDDKHNRPVVDTFYGSLNAHGYFVQGRRSTMEDRYAIVNEPVNNDTGKGSQFVGSVAGVFDGHAGFACAEALANHLPNIIVKSLTDVYEKNVPHCDVLKEIFLEFDKSFCEFAEVHNMVDGSTACVAVIDRDEETGIPTKVTLANTGDTRAIIVRKSGTVKQLTRDHSASLEDERERIERQGGFVEYVASAWFPEDGIDRVNGILAMTRAFGNYKLKPFVTAEPECTTRILRKDDIYLCIASDGLWDVLTNEQVGKILLRSGPKAGAEKLCNLAVENGSFDNVTVVAININPHHL